MTELGSVCQRVLIIRSRREVPARGRLIRKKLFFFSKDKIIEQEKKTRTGKIKNTNKQSNPLIIHTFYFECTLNIYLLYKTFLHKFYKVINVPVLFLLLWINKNFKIHVFNKRIRLIELTIIMTSLYTGFAF